MRRIPGAIVPAVVAALALGCGGDSGSTGKDEDYAERMAREHAADEPVASEGASAIPAAPVEESTVVYASMDGQAIEGYLARPAGADGGIPGILVIHEWWGLNDNIRAMARRLAGEGYAALAIDLYGGEATDDPARARELIGAAMERTDALEETVRQAYRFLADQQGAIRVGTIGWCFGGGWSLRAALLLPREIDATVIYYGRLITDSEQLSALQVPILGIFGAEDEGIPLESVREFESVLAELGKNVTVKVYEGADHAFANPSGKRYQAEAAEDAWARTLAFFEEHLKSP